MRARAADTLRPALAQALEPEATVVVISGGRSNNYNDKHLWRGWPFTSVLPDIVPLTSVEVEKVFP